jgi:cell pole-organizing protein PopZ
MSKPQLASEPSMEEILSSIRKMISDDRPGPSPMPDQLGRMHFGEPARSSPSNNAPVSPTQPGGGQSSNFNSLADALKAATALSDQRRSLQQEIASVIEKGPRRADPLSEAPAPRANPDAAPAADSNGPRLPNFPDWRSEAAAGQPDGKRELMSFDFGTVVPQREDQSAKTAAAADAKLVAAQPSAEAEAPKTGAENAQSKPLQPGEEPRVLPLRSTSGPNGPTLNGTAAHGVGLNGLSPNVAAFPRPVRDTPKPTAEAAPAPVEKSPEKVAKIETPVTADPAPQHVTEAPAAKTEAASAHTEALLDAVVDMVQQDPSKLSVFTSGASFISGVVDKAMGANKPVVADKADAPSVAGAPPKMDRAAAELLRPMLRQWLADNMPRIVEDALRSELTEQTQSDGKGPGKA